MNKTVSVIIPCYNYGRFLRECIESVLGQTYRPIEIIVVNDGSTDETEGISSSFDDRIQYISQPHQGIVQAINTGIERSHGAFFYFLSADDKLFPGTLEKQITVMEKEENCAVICGNAKLIDARRKEIGESIIPLPEKDLLFRMLMSPHLHDGSLLFRRSALEAIGKLYFKPFENYHGYHHRCFQLAKEFKISYLDDFLVYQRVHDGNLSHPRNIEKMIEGYEILRKEMRKHVTPFDLFEGLDPNNPQGMAVAYFKIGALFFFFGQYEIAYDDLKRAVDFKKDIFETPVDLKDLNIGPYLFPIPKGRDLKIDKRWARPLEKEKEDDAKEILRDIAGGNLLKAFFITYRKLEENPTRIEIKYLLSRIYLNQLQFHDSANRFHKVTLKLLKEVYEKDPLHSIDLYLWLAYLDEEKRQDYLDQLQQGLERLSFFDLNECLRLVKHVALTGKKDLMEPLSHVLRKKGLVEKAGVPKANSSPPASPKGKRSGKHRVLFINPPYRRFMQLEQACFPLSFGYMATMLAQSGFEVGIYDAEYDRRFVGRTGSYAFALTHHKLIEEALSNRENPVWYEIEKTIREFEPDLVGISAMTNKYPMVERIAEIVKSLREDIGVVIGGHHPSLYGENLIRNKHIDFAVRGEGEMTMMELAHQFFSSGSDLSSVRGLIYKEKNEIRTTPPRSLIPDINVLPIPDGSLIVNPDYIPSNHLITSRGCPFHCSYCGARVIWTEKVRRRSIENVMEEIKGLIQASGSRHLSFWDDSFTLDRNYIRQLMKRMKTIDGLTFSCITRLDLVDPTMLKELKGAGCNSLLFGIESGSDRILKAIDKGMSRDFIKRKVEDVRSAGIPWLGFFIMGYPGETKEEILETLSFMKELNPSLAEINIFNPLPGTRVWRELEEKGLVHGDMDFSRYSQSSLENLFLQDVSKSEFQALALEMAKVFDHHNQRRNVPREVGLRPVNPLPRRNERGGMGIRDRVEGPLQVGRTACFPTQAHFLMIDRCNSKCIMCGGDYFQSKSGRRITLEKFKRMSLKLHLERFQGIVLAGAGDPLLNPDLIPIIRYVNEQYPHVRVAMTTNGIALSHELSEALLECRLSSINVSINAGSRDVYRRVMQVDCFEKVCQNTRILLSLRNQKGSLPLFQFSSAINRLNIEDLPRMVELGREMGIDSINVVYCRFYPERIRHLNVDREEDRLENHECLYYHQPLSDQFVEQAKSLAQQYGILFYHEPLFKDRPKPLCCVWPEREIMVGFDGEVYPCGGGELHFKEKVEKGIYHFGNALTEPIETFWNGEMYRALRTSSRGEQDLVPECRCCANKGNPKEKKFHVMEWESLGAEPDTGKASIHEIIPSEGRGIKDPLVSVIVPTYDRPEMLVRTLRTILNQTYPNVEVLVVNDGGTDVEKVIPSLNEERSITYIKHDRNRGLAAARNTGIRLARGKYIAYLDDDDLYYPDHLETLVHFLESSDSKVAYTDAYRACQELRNGTYVTTKKDVLYSFDFDETRILKENFIPVLCIVHEKSCLKQVGLFDETLRAHEDWDLWMRMSRKFKFAHIKKITCEFSYRPDHTSMTHGRREDMMDTYRIVARRGSKLMQEGSKQRQIQGAQTVSKIDVSIIIPVFNKLALTRQCIESIRANTAGVIYEIIVVDNGSTDGTVDFLRREEEAGRLKAIVNAENLGFAKACNQGAREASGRTILFLNNDTQVESEWLSPPLRILDGDVTVAAAGSKLLFPDGSLQHAGIAIIEDRKLPDPLVARHLYYRQPSDLPEANFPRQYQALTAACLLIRKDAFDEVKGFDEDYWNGYEDVDLCFKLRERGWRLVYQPESVVIHFESQSGPDRFAKVSENISRLHEKWLGKVKPDLIIEKDGTVRETQAGGIQPYSMVKRPEAILRSAHQQEERVSIVILTFNQSKYTRRCIESIQKHTREPHEILFVDNGSKDGTVKWLRRLVQENPSYKLIENGKNLGFAKGCNQGIRAATGECILLLNNDVIVTEGWLDGMLRCLKSAPDVGIVGPMTNSISGPQRVPGADYGSTNRLEEYAHSFREKNRDRRIPVKRIVGFCMLFKRELTEKIGFLDEQFGSGNFEDDDFCLRAALEGYRNLIAGDVFIHHYGSRSFIGNKIDYTDALSTNRKIFQKKWQGIDAKGPLGMKLLTIHAMEKADELNQKDQVKEAVETLSKGIGYSPNERRLYEMLSELLIDAKKFQEALEVLNRMPSGDSDIWRLERAGYCKEGLENHEEAEEIADLVLSLHPNSPFAWSLKGMVAYKKEDKERAETLFKKAMALDPGYGEPYTNLGVLKWTLNEKGEALDLLERGFILSPTMTDGITTYHSAITATGEFERAERVFGEAKVLYPLNRRIAFLLIDVLIQQGKNDAAMSEIEEALIHFGIDDGILSAALEMRNRLGAKEIDPEAKGTVSLCMIVRDEEENLPRSLMSVKPVVDEMIVVDTGSTDRTREIAGVFGAKVYDYEWADDFSGARNFSLSNATGRWILVVDADEVISPIDHGRLTQIVKERSPQPVAYSLTTRNYVEPVNVSGWTANDGRYKEETGTGWFPGIKVRLFPNDPRIHFEHPVHELVEPSLKKAGIKTKECAVPIHHYGKLSMKRNQRKGEEYLLLGKKKLEERGGDFLSFYELAVQAGELGAFEEAVGLWQKCIELHPENSKAHFNLGYAYLKLGRYEEALSASARAMELAPDFKEAVFNYSLCEFCVGDIQKTIAALEDLIAKEPRYPSAMALLSAAYLIDGKRERGLETLGQMKSMGYDGPVSLYAFADRLISAGRMDSAVLLLERAIETENMNDQIVALLAQCKRTVEKRDQPSLRP